MARSSVFASPGDFSNGANTPIICALSAINTAEMAGLISMELPQHYEKSLSIGALEFPFEGQRLFVCKWFT